LGGEVSERQWSDVLGVLRVTGARLDQDYLRRAAALLGVEDLLRESLDEADIHARSRLTDPPCSLRLTLLTNARLCVDDRDQIAGEKLGGARSPPSINANVAISRGSFG
jgi:hypothetical protein